MEAKHAWFITLNDVTGQQKHLDMNQEAMQLRAVFKGF